MYRRKKTTETILIIVESPSKCAKIEQFLGAEYKCIASKGHLREIANLKAVDVKHDFEVTYSIMKDKEAHVKEMQRTINNFTHIILAMDDDREGEDIAWHICQLFNLPDTTPRIIFHEITKSAILNAVQRPTVINQQLVASQQTRQILDIIVGYTISPILWKHLFYDKDNSLSAGRCQTPALRLVYENHADKTPVEFRYKTTTTFSKLQFILNHEMETADIVAEFLNKSKTHPHILQIGKNKETTRASPKPFNTSRLLQTASNTLKLSPKETMSICQQLYQNGHITYMRTDSTKYAADFLTQAKEFIAVEWDAKYIGDLKNLVAGSDTPHEAVRVTHLEIKSVEGKTGQVYRLIWKNTIESCMADARYNCTALTITAPIGHYSHTLETPVFLGWKTVEYNSQTDIQNTHSGLRLYLHSIAPEIALTLIDSTVVMRNSHQYYTEATLIHKLEELGIGRPSTFASIVDTIQERGYVKCKDVVGETQKCKEYKLRGMVIEMAEQDRVFESQKKKLIIQPVGIATIEFLLTHFGEIFSYDYTKNMEDRLDDITHDVEYKEKGIILCKEWHNKIKDTARATTKQSYPIDATHTVVFEKYGPVIKRELEEGHEFITITKEIDLEKLKNGEYNVDELTESIGTYNNEPIYLKKGKFGTYIECGDVRKSTKIANPTLEEALPLLQTKVMREINSEMSIRNGKFGPYIYYQPKNIKKPQFLKLKPFDDGLHSNSKGDVITTCELGVLTKWIYMTYNLPVK